MELRKLKFITTLLLVGSIAITLIGCDSNTNKTSSELTLAGSTALQPLAEQSGKTYMESNPVTITVQAGGSGSGLKLVSEGTIDIGNSDVFAEEKIDKDKSKELVDNKVCVIGFAMVTSKDVKVDSLTKKQIQDIFTGKVTNWKEVGGNDQVINIINRTKSSGTRATFINTVLDKTIEKEGLGIMQDASGAAEKAVEANKGSITYLALSYLTPEMKKNIKVLNIDNIEPNKDNIVTGKYSFWSYEHMYTKGGSNKVAKAFIEYMMSSENKKLIEKLGYIAISDMKVNK